ncbi:hypothetical protein P3L10_004395 [Capsicum annuum]
MAFFGEWETKAFAIVLFIGTANAAGFGFFTLQKEFGFGIHFLFLGVNWVPLSHQQNQTASVVEVFRIIEEILKFKEVVEYDGNGRLIIAPDGNEFIPAFSARHIVIEAIKPFYTERWGSWNEIQLDIRILMLNQFVTKCAWNSCYENEIQPIFKLKAALRIKEYLYEARKNLEKPGWLNADVWVKLLKK